LWDWGLDSGFCACKANAVPLDPHLQSILLWLYWRWGLENYLPGLASNLDLPDLSLSSSQVYRCESLASGSYLVFIYLFIFEMRSHVVQAGFELVVTPRLASNSQFSCLSLPSAGVTGMY
jgi:hypothetical protein